MWFWPEARTTAEAGLAWGMMASLLLLFYTWCGYPALLWTASRFRRIRFIQRPCTPPVSIIISARNEEARIAERLQNLLELDYPLERLEILVGSDGSSDRTGEIVRRYSDAPVRLLEFPKPRGRASVHNDAAARAEGEILVFTDAATRFERSCLKALVQDFSDARVGCVSGVIEHVNRDATSLTRQRGLYWRFEHWLRGLESESRWLACASGPCMAVRKSLFRPLGNPTYDVDFITPLDVIESGRLVVQEPAAISTDEIFETPRQELRAQARMVAKNLGGYFDRRFLLTSPRHLAFAWTLISHKLLRWATPFLLLLLFLTSTLLALRGAALAVWLGQAMFYAAGLVGWLRVRAERPAGVFSAPFAFCLASAGFLLGVVKVMRNQRVAVW